MTDLYYFSEASLNKVVNIFTTWRWRLSDTIIMKEEIFHFSIFVITITTTILGVKNNSNDKEQIGVVWLHNFGANKNRVNHTQGGVGHSYTIPPFWKRLYSSNRDQDNIVQSHRYGSIIFSNNGNQHWTVKSYPDWRTKILLPKICSKYGTSHYYLHQCCHCHHLLASTSLPILESIQPHRLQLLCIDRLKINMSTLSRSMICRKILLCSN